MDDVCVRRAVTINVALEIYRQKGQRFIPTAASNRHAHLDRATIDALFGTGYQLNASKPLSQPGQYAAEEMIDIVGPKGTIKRIRVLGPERSDSQVEIFYADSYKLGIKPVLRISGDVENTPGAKLVGPKGEMTIQKGVIVAARHIHISPDEARIMGLKNGDVLALKKQGPRGIILENVPVRCGEGHSLECHLDIEEANAGFIKNGELLEVVSVK